MTTTTTRTLELPGMPAPSGATPAARRHALIVQSDALLIDRLVAMASALRAGGPERFAPLARAAGLPLGEVVASPFAARMVALAVSRGATTVHGELRRVIDWPRALRGGRGTADALHGVWDRGVLRLGKYQQFLEDEPFAAYHPDHVAKWGPHELMHRACGFFLRPGCTPWELYLGARLNELLPVVTWYGAEQVMRLDEGAFDRAAAGASPSAEVGRARWLHDPTRPLRARARESVSIFREGLLHLDRELRAIDEEISTGRTIRVAHEFLDASSDALAYVAGHGARLARTGESIAALVPCALDRFEDVRAYRTFVEERFDALLFAPITLELEGGVIGGEARRLREARTVWDFVQRGLQLGSRAAARIAPEAGADVARAVRGEGAPIDVRAWRARVEAEVGPDAIATGDRELGALALSQLADGLASCAPRTLEEKGDRVVRALATSDELLDRAPLATRLARVLAGKRDAKHAALARLEASIASAQRSDDRVEHLGAPASALPDALDDALLVASTAFHVARFDRDALALHAGQRAAGGPHAYLIGAYAGEVSIVPVGDAIVTAFEVLRLRPLGAGEFSELLPAELDARAWIAALIDAGAIAWAPRLAPPLRRVPPVKRAKPARGSRRPRAGTR